MGKTFRRDPYAKELADKKYRQRVVEDKRRKQKHKKEIYREENTNHCLVCSNDHMHCLCS